MGERIHHYPEQPQTGREAADLLRTTLRENESNQHEPPIGTQLSVEGGSFYFDGREESIVPWSSSKMSDVIYVEGTFTGDDGQSGRALLAFSASEQQFSETYQLYLIPPHS